MVNNASAVPEDLSILFVGNPLLDISVDDDGKLLEKYDIKLAQACLANEQ